MMESSLSGGSRKFAHLSGVHGMEENGANGFQKEQFVEHGEIISIAIAVMTS